MEVDPKKKGDQTEFLKNLGAEPSEDDGFWSELMTAVPGIDEATTFGEVLTQVREMNFDLVIFDTAPTGHTLWLLNFPSILDQALVKIMQLKEKIEPMLSSLGPLMGGDQGGDQISKITSKIEEFKGTIDEVNR